MVSTVLQRVVESLRGTPETSVTLCVKYAAIKQTTPLPQTHVLKQKQPQGSAGPDLWCGMREAVGGTARLESRCGPMGQWTAAAWHPDPVLLDLPILSGKA